MRYFVVFWLVAASAPVAFVDATAASKIGFVDLFFVNGGSKKCDPRYWNRLYRNQGDGTRDGAFEDVALAIGSAYDEDGKVFAGMGVDLADYDNDGLPDLFVNALPNQAYALFRDTKGLFEYSTELAALTKGGM